ncbi:GNAT family N-acetyltransferase [Cohnella soli]|uniref:GNAT family N-acetyltransferase n=1 Tax=Cohnella soli TaxID=425005 RepID=A0ABW0I4V3_9BACL
MRYMKPTSGFYCLAGKENDDQFNKSVIRFMNDPMNHNRFFALGIFTDEWDIELNNTFAGETMKFRNGYEYFPLNEKISDDYREKFYPYYKLVWDSNQHFCNFGIGHFLTCNNDLISVCTSPYIGGNFAEIDIITIENYKRQGLATALGVEFIKFE